MPKRAALYIRVSSDEQARHGLSLGEQRADLLSYAKEHGYMVVGIYADEGVTARKALSRRKELQRLLADVEQGLIDIRQSKMIQNNTAVKTAISHEIRASEKMMPSRKPLFLYPCCGI